MLVPLIASHIILILGSFIIGCPKPTFIVTGTHKIGDRALFVLCLVSLKLGQLCASCGWKVGFEEIRIRPHMRVRVEDFQAVSHNIRLLPEFRAAELETSSIEAGELIITTCFPILRPIKMVNTGKILRASLKVARHARLATP
jgi:hypothetical protein